MSSKITLSALLARDEEPSQTLYSGTIDSVIKEPQQIRSLTEGGAKHETLILLTTHSHRLAHFFHRLRSVVRTTPKPPSTNKIAAETIDLLVGVLPYLHQLLEPTKVLDFLVAALDICFASSQRPPMRELASVLASSGTLLEHLVSDHLGIEIVRQWVSMQSIIALDAGTLELWTERLVSMVHNCAIDHGVVHEIQRWHTLKALKNSLKKMEGSTSKSSGKHSTPATRRDLPALGNMTQLNREDKKARPTRHQDTNNTIPSLSDDDKSSLKIFDIHVPGSKSSLLETIQRLEGEKTTAILLSIASKFPCYLCISGLGSLSQSSKGRTHDESFQAVSVPQIEILDKGFGVCRVLLSPQALKSVLHMGSHGLVGSVTEKLNEIASGRWTPQYQLLAGSKSQRKCLRVPVARTICGQHQSILWQIAIGMDEETELPQQEIKVWEVCDSSEISKILDRVIFLHQSYSDETVRRCRQHSSAIDGMQIPARFEDSSSHLTNLARPSADLDIRTVDQDIIEMTNKFYALTEPVIRSILSNDLSAEFPFDLSREEARVIRHFRTASLILGRSGTGKTTCLVFKLVGKYLASKAVVDERPVRQVSYNPLVGMFLAFNWAQVLLTRSSFLANKLSSYTRRLIETLSSKSIDLDSSQQSEYTFSMTTEEDLGKTTVFTLIDQSFPLVCTWEGFLGILENTTVKLDRKNFDAIGEPTDQQFDELANTRHSAHDQLVDFHAFKLDYWPHFSHMLTKNLSVNLVFAEIMGVIKGSASSRGSLAPLSREAYLMQSCRLAPTFVLEAERLRVYEIFKMYEKLKLEMGGVDHIDRVVRLLRAVRQDSSLKQLLRSTFDEVYIDEIQDQRCLDIELLLSFIRDSRGFHFAGDTAQAISQDSTFRFNDIKALFYEHFAAASATTHQGELARPQMFTLSKNYRSHEGILALASLVMGMIWKGFPETVDKLEPEIGHLNGPQPVLFHGVDFNILRSSNVGHITLSAGTADFGAEQVILVRDANMKISLQQKIGDVALILTILESKGMEFDDVILWNFFTECPDQAGVRSLEILKKEPEMFDPRRHGGMCSELKHLYVAITRARVQLFIMESSETTATTALKFLGKDISGSFVQVTSPTHEDFAMRLEMLRPGTSLDPRQWSRRGAELMHRRMYKDTLRCFRKAQDLCGETIAEGHLREEEGRRCNAVNDIEGFTQNLTLAVDCFLKENLINDAARVLVALGKSEEAAEMLFQDRQYSKAAHLFAVAGLSTKAIDCHHLAREYSEAAAILNKERNYDRLVSYLDENCRNIPANTLQGYSLLCKLLLKQNKTSPECRKHAIRVLGSSAEQEKCFLEYRMDDELAELYASQLRYKDLFHLHSKKGQLDRALSLAITKDLLKHSADGLEPEVLRLLDYVWAGHLGKNRLQHSAAPLKLPSGFLTPNIIVRAEQWEASNLVYSLEDSIARQHVAGMKSTVPITVLCLRKIFGATAITQITNLNDLPFEMMQEAVKFARDLILDKDSDALKTVLLLTGLWKPGSGKGHFIMLPWSPLQNSMTDVSNVDPVKVVTQRVLDRLVSAILALDAKARDLWKEKWPKRCVQFMTVGFCPRKRNGEKCDWLHQLVSADDFSRMLDGLLRMNSIFCNLAVLYYRRSMNGIFLEKYMGIKRHWLERLLRELTHLSSVEQDTSVIMRTQAELFRDKKFIAISSFLEALLYFRLGNEWEQRSDFTSLLEQMQLAKVLGSNVQSCLFRALSHRLFVDRRVLMQRHLGLLNSLKENVGHWNASFFQDNLKTFLRNLDNVEVPALSTLHSLTAVFEYLAAYLVLKLCVIACVIPNSWIDLHVASISKAIHSPEPLQEDDKHRYQTCLIQLAKSFCQILSRLNKAILPTDFLLCSGNTHHPLLLRQRNAELVATLVANLAATTPQQPIGTNEVWARAKEVFEYDFVKAFHLRSRTPDELAQKLAPSFAKYNGKDALVMVIKDRKKGTAFSNLEHQPGVRTVPFDQLCPRAPTSAVADNSAYQQASPNSTDSAHEQYGTAETEAMIRIQRLWRSCSLKIKSRRSYVSVPVCRATARFFNLSAQYPATVTSGDRKAVRKFLVSYGVALSLRLDIAKGLLSKLQTGATTCIENVEISQGADKSVDDILSRNRDVEALLEKAEVKMSDECLAVLLELGVLSVLEKAMKDVEDIVVEAEQVMLETKKLVDVVSRNCT